MMEPADFIFFLLVGAGGVAIFVFWWLMPRD